ncbi:MAG TPA: hypothetical protein PKA00_08615, partial [Saprospiraceae bacterium]|nr:hypothetical protein [Saprospiraceae bacterium]HMQ82957.1 hypothetical protein [Saprospiraceae bacterium]
MKSQSFTRNCLLLLGALTISLLPLRLHAQCSVTVVSATPTVCTDSQYDLSVNLTYTTPPSGDIVLAIGEGPGTLYTFTPDGSSPDTYIINGLTASGVQDINVTAYFVNDPVCTNTLIDAYDAPAGCGDYCSGNLLLNPSFEITSANVTPPPIGVEYTPADWVAPNRAYADYDWLRPDGIAHLGLYGTGTSVAYQNVPVTVGNAYTLTLYSAMHFPLVNVGTATLQYYDAGDNPIGATVVHTVTHDWEDDYGFGGPYMLALSAAPANASYVRITLENQNPTASGESVKFDALCLTSQACVNPILSTPDPGVCTYNMANNRSEATISVDISWGVASPGEFISVELQGGSVFSTNPVTIDPAMFPGGMTTATFDVVADGSGPHGILAQFTTTTSCSATEQVTFVNACCPPNAYDICEDGSTTVTLTADAGLTNVVWYNSSNVSVGVGPVLTVDASILPFSDDLMDGTEDYYYTADDIDGCMGQLCCPVTVNRTEKLVAGMDGMTTICETSITPILLAALLTGEDAGG